MANFPTIEQLQQISLSQNCLDPQMPPVSQCQIKVDDWVSYVYLAQFLLTVVLAILLIVKLKWFTPDRKEQIRNLIKLKVQRQNELKALHKKDYLLNNLDKTGFNYSQSVRETSPSKLKKSKTKDSSQLESFREKMIFNTIMPTENGFSDGLSYLKKLEERNSSMSKQLNTIKVFQPSNSENKITHSNFSYDNDDKTQIYFNDHSYHDETNNKLINSTHENLSQMVYQNIQNQNEQLDTLIIQRLQQERTSLQNNGRKMSEKSQQSSNVGDRSILSQKSNKNRSSLPGVQMLKNAIQQQQKRQNEQDHANIMSSFVSNSNNY